jgi:hypothetical protein
VSEAWEEEGHCVMRVTWDSVWNVFENTTPSSISTVIKILFLHNSYKFTVPKVILKYFGAHILILCTCLSIMSKLRGKNFFPNLLLFK